MRVSLNNYPAAQKTYAETFPKLTGGLNLWELDYRLGQNESPNMWNLWWQDGVLQCRDGQVYIEDSEERGAGYTCYGDLFWGYAFFHIGGKLYCGFVPETEEARDGFALTELVDGVPENRGTFFRYLDWLFYKNRGAFLRITYNPDPVEGETTFTAERMEEIAYTPVIQLNSDPEVGGGDSYQPENRLSPKKTVRYNAKEGAKVYHLPVKEIDSVTKVTVDGEELEETADYTVDPAAGTVTFVTAPPVTDPPTNNTVEITYSKENPDALKSVLDCPYAFVAGGDRNICILLAGSMEQPNAIFWNANDNLSMNPGYFPLMNYNLVGDTMDPVSGFGRQYSDTIVFKEHSVGKLGFTVETIDDRNSISFTYTAINGKTGCDLPWSIQLIENNLVFCNTYQGVHVIRSSSAAYENNIQCLSLKVNGRETDGLVRDVRQAKTVCSFDDDQRYWLCADGIVYAWDYTVSDQNEPSWFRFSHVPAVCFFQDDGHHKFHLNSKGQVSEFRRVFVDYGASIEKVYQFPTQFFGSYDRLKDVTSILVSIRSDTDTVVAIRYDSDYETRFDLTPISAFSWRLSPRNLGYRCLSSEKYAHTVRRKPGCRHVQHFSMTFSNNEAGCDLSIVSAQIFYKFQGRER